MSVSTVRSAYLESLAFAASRVATTEEARDFAEHFVGSVARISNRDEWPAISSVFAAWVQDQAIADFELIAA